MKDCPWGWLRRDHQNSAHLKLVICQLFEDGKSERGIAALVPVTNIYIHKVLTTFKNKGPDFIKKLKTEFLIIEREKRRFHRWIDFSGYIQVQARNEPGAVPLEEKARTTLTPREREIANLLASRFNQCRGSKNPWNYFKFPQGGKVQDEKKVRKQLTFPFNI